MGQVMAWLRTRYEYYKLCLWLRVLLAVIGAVATIGVLPILYGLMVALIYRQWHQRGHMVLKVGQKQIMTIVHDVLKEEKEHHKIIPMDIRQTSGDIIEVTQNLEHFKTEGHWIFTSHAKSLNTVRLNIEARLHPIGFVAGLGMYIIGKKGPIIYYKAKILEKMQQPLDIVVYEKIKKETRKLVPNPVATITERAIKRLWSMGKKALKPVKDYIMQ